MPYEALAFVDSWVPPAWFEHVTVVAVETTDAVNVGGIVRAMANTGFLKLRLVRPVGFDAWHVGGVAHYTQHIVSTVQTFECLDEAVADRQFVVGLTGRHTRVERNALPLSSAVDQLVEAAMAGQQVALVLGREDRGLSNEMLDACHAVTTIPTNPAYPSLNLAQAVPLVLYQVFQRAGGGPRRQHPAQGPERAVGAAGRPVRGCRAALDAIGFCTADRAQRAAIAAVALFRAS
jgi:tRNA/rRNA methyltransferase